MTLALTFSTQLSAISKSDRGGLCLRTAHVNGDKTGRFLCVFSFRRTDDEKVHVGDRVAVTIAVTDADVDGGVVGQIETIERINADLRIRASFSDPIVGHLEFGCEIDVCKDLFVGQRVVISVKIKDEALEVADRG